MVEVTFTPTGSAANPAPGPYSIGVTDEQGKFTLRTRRDDQGAVPGPHKVGIEYGDSDELWSLEAQLVEANSEQKAKIKEDIAEFKAQYKSRKKIPENLTFNFVVPDEGTSSADFELNLQ